MKHCPNLFFPPTIIFLSPSENNKDDIDLLTKSIQSENLPPLFKLNLTICIFVLFKLNAIVKILFSITPVIKLHFLSSSKVL